MSLRLSNDGSDCSGALLAVRFDENCISYFSVLSRKNTQESKLIELLG